MELIHAFGLDIRIFFAQLINFAILLWILHRFAYQPVLKALDERKTRIEKGLADAGAAKARLADATADAQEILKQAKQEAKAMLAQAEQSGKKQSEQLIAIAKEETDRMLLSAAAAIEDEKKKMLSEAKTQLAELVVAATEKVLEEKVDAKKDAEIIDRALHTV